MLSFLRKKNLIFENQKKRINNEDLLIISNNDTSTMSMEIALISFFVDFVSGSTI